MDVVGMDMVDMLDMVYNVHGGHGHGEYFSGVTISPE